MREENKLGMVTKETFRLIRNLEECSIGQSTKKLKKNLGDSFDLFVQDGCCHPMFCLFRLLNKSIKTFSSTEEKSFLKLRHDRQRTVWSLQRSNAWEEAELRAVRVVRHRNIYLLNFTSSETVNCFITLFRNVTQFMNRFSLTDFTEISILRASSSALKSRISGCNRSESWCLRQVA